MDEYKNLYIDFRSPKIAKPVIKFSSWIFIPDKNVVKSDVCFFLRDFNKLQFFQKFACALSSKLLLPTSKEKNKIKSFGGIVKR